MKMRFSIRTKYVGLLLGAFALILVVFFIFEFQIVRELSYQQADETARGFTRLFENLVRGKPELFNTQSLQPIVRQFNERVPVPVRFRIVDRSLLVIADSDSSKIGSYANSAELRETLSRHESGAVLKEGASQLRIDGPITASQDNVESVIGFISVEVPLAPIQSKITNDFRKVTLILLGLTLAFIIYHYVQIQLTLVRPLFALASVTSRIGAGELSARAEGLRRDEIGDLGRSINQMAWRLEEANGALLVEIQERKLAQIEVEAAMQQAESANLAKGDFLANMSHEIRTPLNGVVGMLSLLLDDGLNARQRELAEISKASADALLTIINDILDFSKIEAGKLNVEAIPFDLRLLVEEVGGVVALKAEEKGLDLIVRYSPGMPRYVISDPGRIRQCLLNLISNAIKFTSEGYVLVMVKLDEQSAGEATVRFCVIDTGIGISADQLEHIFGRFTQVDASTTRIFGGTGLGLAITKRLAELLNGTVGVTSVPGSGSRFWFTSRLKLDANQLETNLRPMQLADVKILIVGHSEMTRIVLHEQVLSWGMRDGCAESAEDALAKLRAERDAGDAYQIVLIDHHVPEVDGLELGRSIRADENLRDLKLILVSSIRREEDTHRAREAGFAAYLTKPVRQSQLMDTLVTIWLNEEKSPIITESALKEAHGVVNEDRNRFSARVLVVDDNSVNQRVAQLALKRLGCSVDLASDGAEAIKMVQEIPYDIVFMDCEMPLMDGFSATAQIRRQEQNDLRTPIVAMTARALHGDRQRCIDAGMNDYLTKPVRLEDFARILVRWTKESKVNEPMTRLSSRDPLCSASREKPLGALELSRLRALVPNEEVLKELFDTFLDQSSELIDGLRVAAQKEQHNELQKLSHKLSGAAANLGASRMTNICRQLNDLSNQQALDQAMPLVDQLAEEFCLVRSSMLQFGESVKA